jgi:hypothetical protein
MHNNANTCVPMPGKINLLDSKALVYGTISVPKDHAGPAQRLCVAPTHRELWIPNRHFFHGNVHCLGCVSAKVLIWKK